MKLGLVQTLGIIAAGSVSFAAVPAIAQITANGPYYANPSWDQTLPVATRFLILNNFSTDAVLDRETGLVWERAPDTTRRTRRPAASACHDKAIGGHKGWRLPTIEELASLVDPAQASPALPAGHPFIGVAFGIVPIFQVYYWSSSAFPAEAGITVPPAPPTVDTEVLDFRDGTVKVSNSTASSMLSWCVRGPGGHNGD